MAFGFKKIFEVLNKAFPAPEYLTLNPSAIDIASDAIYFMRLKKTREGIVPNKFEKITKFSEAEGAAKAEATTNTASVDSSVETATDVERVAVPAIADLAANVDRIKTLLLAAEEEAEDSASAAVKQTRMRERLEREGRERVAALESQLESKVREAANLHEAASNADAAHARDLEVRKRSWCATLT